MSKPTRTLPKPVPPKSDMRRGSEAESGADKSVNRALGNDRGSTDLIQLKREMKDYVEQVLQKEVKRSIKGIKMPKCDHKCGYMNAPPYASQPLQQA